MVSWNELNLPLKIVGVLVWGVKMKGCGWMRGVKGD